jgi:hypothetical protein
VRRDLGESYRTDRLPPTGSFRLAAHGLRFANNEELSVNSIIYIVGLVVVVVAVLSFFGLR